jgi:tyrosine-protein kinase Etk/Wzc
MEESRERHNDEQGKHLFDYVHIILRRKAVFLVVFFAIFGGAVYKSQHAVRIYEAFATLLVNDMGRFAKTADVMQMQLPLTNPIDTEIEILKSRAFAEAVAKRLSLGWQVSDKSPGFEFKLLEFSAEKDASFHLELTGPNTYRLADEQGKTLGEGIGNKRLRVKGLMLLIDIIKGQKGDTVNLRYVPQKTVVADVMNNISASEIRDTGIIRLSCTSPVPELARDIVNTVIQVYIERNITDKSEEVSNSLIFIAEQMNELRNELDRADMTTITPLMNNLKDLENRKRLLLTEVTGMHPAVRSLQAQINRVQDKLQSSVEGALGALSKKGALTKPLEGDSSAELKRDAVLNRELIKRSRDNKVSEELYTSLLQKYAELRIAKAATTSNIKVIDEATLPEYSIRPNRRKDYLTGFLTAVLFGLLAVFFVEYLDDTIKDPETAKRVFNAPLLAIIPHIPTENDDVRGEEAKQKRLITVLAPKAQASEAFRALRTSIHFSGARRKRQVMMVTSSFSGEGKSTIAANLAVALAQAGGRVALLDCDLRRPSLHALFKLGKVPGLSEVLAGDLSADEILHGTEVPGLDIYCSGTVPPNPSELLGSEQMEKLLEDLKGRYDSILLDAPPVLAVTDAPLLTTATHMVLLVVEGGKVPVKAARRVHEMLSDLKAPLAGLVLNDKAAASGKGYYGAYGYYTSYRYGYSRYGYNYRQDYYGEDEKKPWWKNLLKRK